MTIRTELQVKIVELNAKLGGLRPRDAIATDWEKRKAMHAARLKDPGATATAWCKVEDARERAEKAQAELADHDATTAEIAAHNKALADLGQFE